VKVSLIALKNHAKKIDMQQVLAIKSALSQKPTFMRVDDPNMTLDQAIMGAVQSLNGAGKSVEAQTLKSLYDNHTMLNKDKTVEKGDKLSALTAEPRMVNGTEISVIEIDLITAHAGGL
jgi:ABC-type dipeptide/oligopeptide/nickel transport system ATPase component